MLGNSQQNAMRWSDDNTIGRAMANRMKALHLRIAIGAVILLLAALVWFYRMSFGARY